MPAPTVPAELLAIDVAEDRTLTVSVSTSTGTAYARTELSLAECAALPHFTALFGHDARCPGRADVLRGALERIAGALGAPRPVVVIRLGDAPAFWLRLVGTPDGREVELGVLDTVALLLGDRVGLAIEAGGAAAGGRGHGA